VILASSTDVAVTNLADSLEVSGAISGGSGSVLTKTGAGTLVLSSASNSYAGTTTISGGKLLVNGTNSGGGTVNVSGGGTLGGTGTIAGPVIVDGILAPGVMIGKLTTGALTMDNLSTFAYEMDSGVLGNDKGSLLVTGALTLYGHVNLTLSASAFTPNTTTLSLMQYTGTLLGGGGFFYGATQLLDGTTFSDGLNTWKISYAANSGGLNFATPIPGSHFITLSNLTAVPEPGSLLALGCLVGSGAFLRIRRRR